MSERLACGFVWIYVDLVRLVEVSMATVRI